jgi:AraC-like DNA-binding protein
MLMIPLPFVLALLVAAFLVFEWMQRGTSQRGGWLLAFLGLLVFQEVLVGLRFGYGIDWLRQVQPVSAALLPPLAYLSFRRSAVTASLLVHVLPFVGVILSVSVLPLALDTVLALSNLVYAGLLIRLGLRGTDGLGWVETHRSRAVVLVLWLVVAVLFLSGLADGAISYDFWTTQGDNTARIAGWVSAIGMVSVTLGVIAYRIFAKPDAKMRVADPVDVEVFDALQTMMAREKLHLDPDINLNRVSRRLVRPARDVSKSINGQTGGNFSQYINGLRIEEACRLLGGDMPITQIVFASGFNTKSNFNREFSRITGKSPSEWRSANG